MAIITLEQYQDLTGDTAHDTQVEMLIPYVQADFVSMCNFDFNQDTDDEEFPDGCELYVAKMISFQINDLGSDGDQLESENIDGYSYKSRGGDSGSTIYPGALEKHIVDNWRYCGFKGGSIREQYRDKRGFSPKQLVESE